jgi:hypothetical protein
LNPTFVPLSSESREQYRVLVEKMTQKRLFFTTFFTKLTIFLGYRLNISTNELVLERLLNFWNFETYLTKIPHPVRVRKPPKVKNFEIGVARKLDLIEPNWVYSFSSLIRLYQTRIVSPILVSMIFNLLDRVKGGHRSVSLIFIFSAFGKPPMAGKFSIKHIWMSDYHVKISGKSGPLALQNLIEQGVRL